MRVISRTGCSGRRGTGFAKSPSPYPLPEYRLSLPTSSGIGCGGLETRSDLRASTAIAASPGRFPEMWVMTSGVPGEGSCRAVAITPDERKRPPAASRDRSIRSGKRQAAVVTQAIDALLLNRDRFFSTLRGGRVVGRVAIFVERVLMLHGAQLMSGESEIFGGRAVRVLLEGI